jgi:MFS family permease
LPSPSYLLVITGTIIFALSLFMLSLTHPNAYYQVFLAHGLGSAIGAGLLYVPSLAVLAHHFSGPRRAAVMMLAASGASFGGLTHPIMLNNLFAKVGFREGVRASAGMCTGLNVLACALIRTRLPSKRQQPLGPIFLAFMRDVPYMLVVLG